MSPILTIESSDQDAVNNCDPEQETYLQNLRSRLLFTSPPKEKAIEDARTEGCNI